MSDTLVRHPLAGPELATSIRAFIETVLGDLRGNAVMSLASGLTPGNKLRVDRHSWFAYPQQIDQMVQFAVRNAERDVYLSPIIYGEQRNQARQITRTLTNAIASNTIYLDSDDCPPDAFRVPPTIHVQTSEHHGHDYWVLNEPIAAREAAEISHRMTIAHKADGCDPSAWSANKVLRVPTVHTHPEFWPITWTTTGSVYNALDISGAYGDIEIGTAANVDQPGLNNEPAGLLEKEAVLQLIEKIPTSERRLTDLLFKTPKGGEKGWRSEQRYALMLDLLRFGFTEAEAGSIVWYAPAGQKWRDDDPRGTEGLWYEMRKAAAEVGIETGRSIEPAPERKARAKGPRLLTKTERDAFGTRSDWLTLYNESARTRVPVFNRPLHDSNGWVLLSTTYGMTGYVPKGDGPMPCNLFVLQVAPSSEGKSEAARIMESWIRSTFPHDDPFVAVDSSKNALVEHLLERDGLTALLRGDEAHGQFREMQNSSWMNGLQELWTDIYDGRVRPVGRVGKKELRSAALVAASMHLSGTPDEMFTYLTREMFRSGYLARQIWVFGESHPVTEETLRTRQVVGDDTIEYDALPMYWGSVAFRNRAKIQRHTNGKRAQMVMTTEALERYDAAKVLIHRHFAADAEDEELFKPARNRMYDIMWKAAALYAMADGRPYIRTSDVIVALGFTEIWLDAMIEAASRISATLFSRACDEIERFVAGKEAKEAPVSAVYRRFSSERVRFVDEYIESLIKQGRLYEPQAGAEQERRLRIKGAK